MSGRPWSRVERIGDVVAGALPARVRRGLLGWRAVALWADVVGEGAARRSAAVSFRDGRLLVEVVNSVWMQQLSASTRRHLRDLNAALGNTVVEEIVYRINPSLSAKARHERRTDTGEGSRDRSV